MRTRPVLVEFFHKSDAAYLLSNRRELPRGVFADQQYSDETERERRMLRPILRAARRHDNYKGKCRMSGAKLVIKGRNYDRSNLHCLPFEINGYSATSKTQENLIGFFGELNPLSNFHPAPFTINGQKYHSSEQFIQHQKCLLFNDHENGARVLSAETALDCKLISKDVKNFDHERWKQNVKASCTPGILAKFEQNKLLGDLLKSTGSKKLVECCKDKNWGTGIPLHAGDALDSTKWQSQGWLGEILESVRSIIANNSMETATMEQTDPNLQGT